MIISEKSLIIYRKFKKIKRFYSLDFDVAESSILRMEGGMPDGLRRTGAVAIGGHKRARCVTMMKEVDGCAVLFRDAILFWTNADGE